MGTLLPIWLWRNSCNYLTDCNSDHLQALLALVEFMDEGEECDNESSLGGDELLVDFSDNVKRVGGGGHNAKMEAAMWKGLTLSALLMARSVIVVPFGFSFK